MAKDLSIFWVGKKSICHILDTIGHVTQSSAVEKIHDHDILKEELKNWQSNANPQLYERIFNWFRGVLKPGQRYGQIAMIWVGDQFEKPSDKDKDETPTDHDYAEKTIRFVRSHTRRSNVLLIAVGSRIGKNQSKRLMNIGAHGVIEQSIIFSQNTRQLEHQIDTIITSCSMGYRDALEAKGQIYRNILFDIALGAFLMPAVASVVAVSFAKLLELLFFPPK